MKRTIKLSSYSQERATRSGEFALVPDNTGLPVIVSQPLRNFAQYTWIEGVQDGITNFQKIRPTFDTYTILQGTEFSLGLRVADLSNTLDVNDTSNLSYKWKKDESSVYELNRLNGGVGVSAFLIPRNNSKAPLSGKYTCEITNPFGTVTTEPINIEIVDPLKHPKLCKNLILNGDGDGGNDGWQSDPDIKTTPFANDHFATKNFGSFRLGDLISFQSRSDKTVDDKNVLTGDPYDFYFSRSAHYSLFFPLFWKRYEADPTMKNMNVVSDPTLVLSTDEQWTTSCILPQIVLNEDYNKSELAGFFPGIAWLDEYNKNDKKVISLHDEFKNYSSTYFTRNKLKFEKFGGTPEVAMNQTIDIADLSNFVDGNVGGVKYATSHFFAYVGAGITGYRIKVKTTDGVMDFNYYIADSEVVYNNLAGRGQTPSFSIAAQAKFQLVPNTDIEITPLVEDVTTVSLDYLTETGRVLKTEIVNGPSARDVWAIKEKVFFPLTLYPIYRWLNAGSPAGHNITVFGQTYTTTKAIGKLASVGDTNTFRSLQYQHDAANAVTDVNAKYLLNKYDFGKWGASYPKPFWWQDSGGTSETFTSLNDYGAAAMFGVGRNTIIPPGTKSIRVSVTFTHTSDIIRDTTPEMKSWTNQEIYSNEYGQSTGVSARLVEYGNPRCGVTKMKLLVVPNDVSVTEDYATYLIPPAEATVLGLQKAKYGLSDAFNTANKTDFVYELTQPEAMPEPPPTDNPFDIAQSSNIQSQSSSAALHATTVQAAVLATVPLDPAFTDSNNIAETEDVDAGKGDYKDITGTEF